IARTVESRCRLHRELSRPINEAIGQSEGSVHVCVRSNGSSHSSVVNSRTRSDGSLAGPAEDCVQQPVPEIWPPSLRTTRGTILAIWFPTGILAVGPPRECKR